MSKNVVKAEALELKLKNVTDFHGLNKFISNLNKINKKYIPDILGHEIFLKKLKEIDSINSFVDLFSFSDSEMAVNFLMKKGVLPVISKDVATSSKLIDKIKSFDNENIFNVLNIPGNIGPLSAYSGAKDVLDLVRKLPSDQQIEILSLGKNASSLANQGSRSEIIDLLETYDEGSKNRIATADNFLLTLLRNKSGQIVTDLVKALTDEMKFDVFLRWNHVKTFCDYGFGPQVASMITQLPQSMQVTLYKNSNVMNGFLNRPEADIILSHIKKMDRPLKLDILSSGHALKLANTTSHLKEFIEDTFSYGHEDVKRILLSCETVLSLCNKGYGSKITNYLDSLGDDARLEILKQRHSCLGLIKNGHSDYVFDVLEKFDERKQVYLLSSGNVTWALAQSDPERLLSLIGKLSPEDQATVLESGNAVLGFFPDNKTRIFELIRKMPEKSDQGDVLQTDILCSSDVANILISKGLDEDTLGLIEDMSVLCQADVLCVPGVIQRLCKKGYAPDVMDLLEDMDESLREEILDANGSRELLTKAMEKPVSP